ncbi:hypothetical protein DSO57_1016975, partial [Entomophthora muscae]
MRCYTDGQYNRNSTKIACEDAGLEFNGNACWAREFRFRVGKHFVHCEDIAPHYCPHFYKRKK